MSIIATPPGAGFVNYDNDGVSRGGERHGPGLAGRGVADAV